MTVHQLQFNLYNVHCIRSTRTAESLECELPYAIWGQRVASDVAKEGTGPSMGNGGIGHWGTLPFPFKKHSIPADRLDEKGEGNDISETSSRLTPVP